jgi:lipoprotein NlpD
VQRNADAQRYYTVKAGDTLYSIARHYGRDYRDIAAANGIGPPYELRIGQQLVVSEVSSARPEEAGHLADAGPGAEIFALPPQPVVDAPAQESVPAQPAEAAVSKSQSRPEPQKKTASASTPSKKQLAPLPKHAPARGKWKWPANGAAVKTSSNGDGLNISGKLGAPVFASAPGRVVYQGSGLRGYGKLIIIKHSDEYLSAYAHNDKLLVQEGQQVRQGQQIAEMGKTGTDRVMLHFQIRRNGTPVNPLKLLPKR